MEEKLRIYSEKKYFNKNATKGNKKGIWSYSYKYSGQKSFWARTDESPQEYDRRISIIKINSNTTINFKGKNYTLNQLDIIYKDLAESELNKTFNTPDIDVSQEINEIKRKELEDWQTKMAASRWKSTQRSLRKKGRLDQYKIDALNKLGMVWNPKEDEWEKNYLKFRNIGFCSELEIWIKKQRTLFNLNEISNENLLRLNAIKFPFETLPNEEYPLTTKSVWELKEKLEKKIRKLELKQEKNSETYENKKKNKLIKKEKDSQKEVNSFYRRKFQYCSGDFIFELNEKDALNKIHQIDKGISIYKGRLKNFLDSESNKYKSEGRKTPSWVSKFYTEVIDSESKLTPNEKYNELSLFNSSKFNSVIRTKACEYMLSYISNRNLNNSNSFKEINYLISIYKKERDIIELKLLLDFINKYPLLFELYNNKIEKEIIKL